MVANIRYNTLIIENPEGIVTTPPLRHATENAAGGRGLTPDIFAEKHTIINRRGSIISANLLAVTAALSLTVYVTSRNLGNTRSTKARVTVVQEGVLSNFIFAVMPTHIDSHIS